MGGMRSVCGVVMCGSEPTVGEQWASTQSELAHKAHLMGAGR